MGRGKRQSAAPIGLTADFRDRRRRRVPVDRALQEVQREYHLSFPLIATVEFDDLDEDEVSQLYDLREEFELSLEGAAVVVSSLSAEFVGRVGVVGDLTRSLASSSLPDEALYARSALNAALKASALLRTLAHQYVPPSPEQPSGTIGLFISLVKQGPEKKPYIVNAAEVAALLENEELAELMAAHETL
jgi:hypothetical protein